MGTLPCVVQCCLFSGPDRSYILQGVNRVQVVLSGFSVRLFCFVKAKTLCRCGCMYFLAALVLMCVDVMVMSSAKAMTQTGAIGGGISAVYMLKSVGERTPPCGKPVLN